MKKRKDYFKNYYSNPENKKRHNDAEKKYYLNNKEKIKNNKRTIHYKKLKKSYDLKYAKEHREIINKIKKKYKKTEKGKENQRKHLAKYRRKLGYVQIIDNPFPEEIEVEYHHINDLLVVPIPKKLHEINCHPNAEIHREKCNNFIENFYGLTVKT